MRLEGGASLGPEYPTHEHWPEHPHPAYLILLGVRHLGRAGRVNIHFGPAANSLHRLSLEIILIRASCAQPVVRPSMMGGQHQGPHHMWPHGDGKIPDIFNQKEFFSTARNL